MTNTDELRKLFPSIKRKPPTNGDRIRSMTDEKLANWYFNEFFKKTPYCIIPDCTEKNRCEDCLIAWLKQGVNDEV